MDTSVSNSPFGGMKGSFTPRTRQSSASSAMSSRKSVLGGFKKGLNSSRYSLSGRSNQSVQIIAKSDNFVVESFGMPLPVLVNEALTFSERSSSVSINCSANGWAWAVCGRRLLLWQYKESENISPKFDARTPQRRAATGQCRELTLPHCDIGLKASLVTVFLPEGQQMASCLAVTPTGDVRYWPSIAHDGSSVDVNGILEGQEFDELVSLSSVGYVLATTTCNLVVLQLQLHSGRHTIVHRAIRPPTGFLGGFGKKFASILIGMNTNLDRENKFIKLTADQSGQNDDDWSVTVLADRWVQRWKLSSNANETFIFEDLEIFRKIRDTFHQKLWSNRDCTEVEIRLLDMQSFDKKIVILAAAINASNTPQIYYALITLAESLSTFVINSYCQLKHNSFYTGNVLADNLKLKFILNRNIAYVYDEKVIYQVYMNDLTNIDMEKIEFPTQGDKLMTGIICNNTPLFFSRMYGLVCIMPSDSESPDFLNSSISEAFNAADGMFFSQSISMHAENAHSLSIYDLNPEEIYDSDAVNQLKAAFIYHLKKNTLKCTEILKDLLATDNSTKDIDLNNVVVAIAMDLADDIPLADPRWENQANSNKHALGSSVSMQIIQQLKEKDLALNHFIDFLHSTDLWEHLTKITERGTVKSTCQFLSDIYEKIVAAMSLKRIHASYSKIMDDAIEFVLKQRNDKLSGNLTSQDLFYVKTTKIHEIFKALVFHNADNGQVDTSSRLIDINSIILTVLGDILKFRDVKRGLFELPPLQQYKFEYLPWTAATGSRGSIFLSSVKDLIGLTSELLGLKDIILHQIGVTLKNGARSTGEPENRQLHYKQLVELIDFVLDGRKSYLDSIRDSEKYSVTLQQYEAQRSDLIFPFVKDNQYELATKLAEKYLDFQVLVQICDQTKNQARLEEYIDKYQELNFSQFAINWHMRQNKRGDLFERFKHNQADLSKFLSDHPSMAWIQSVFNGDMTKASRILFELAQNETELLARKKTILSLGKLTSIASEDDTSMQVAHIDSELHLIQYQNDVPSYLLDAFGYDTEQPKVLKAEEIINLLISEDNTNATEADYRKALELLGYVEDAIDVRHKIWCSAILRDSWDTYNINSPQDDLQEMMFFKLVDLCSFLDPDTEIDDILPPIEDFLTAPELAKLTSEKSFQFLFKLGYEYIHESYNRKL